MVSHIVSVSVSVHLEIIFNLEHYVKKEKK